jgi:hypothetical protein
MIVDDAYRLLERKDVHKKVVECLEGTKARNSEHAFDICSGQHVSTTNMEEGSEYHVDIRNKCPIGTRSLGNVHTHVHLSESNNDAIPSSGDMMETIERDLNFVCVAGHGKDNSPVARCFSHNDIKSEINTVLSTKKLAHNEENVRKASRSLTKRMMKDKEYLNKMSQMKT